VTTHKRAKGGGRKPFPRLSPEQCRLLIPVPAAHTAAKLGVTRQAVEAVRRNGATVAQIDRWVKLLTKDA
jgi:hypothetical protein